MGLCGFLGRKSCFYLRFRWFLGWLRGFEGIEVFWGFWGFEGVMGCLWTDLYLAFRSRFDFLGRPIFVKEVVGFVRREFWLPFLLEMFLTTFVVRKSYFFIIRSMASL